MTLFVPRVARVDGRAACRHAPTARRRAPPPRRLGELGAPVALGELRARVFVLRVVGRRSAHLLAARRIPMLTSRLFSEQLKGR